MKKIIIFFLVILISAGVYFFGFSNGKDGGKYITDTIKKRTLTTIVEASGTIQPINKVDVGAQVSGKIVEMYVDYNSKVEKGQLLAQIDTSLFEASLNQSNANIMNAKASLAKAQAKIEYDKNTYERYSNLYKRNLVSKDDVESKRAQYLADKAEIAAAHASIAQAQANLGTAKANLGYTKIISPVKGTIISKSVEVGQTVASSYQTPTLFTVAEDLTKMQIETSVSEADIGKVKEGQEVEYTLDGYPDETFMGTVTQVRCSPKTESNVVTYTVIIGVDNADGKMMPGMTANVSIITNKSEDVLTVPNRALRFSPETNKQKYEEQGIWVQENGQPVRKTIKVGVSNDSYTEIEGEDLNENDVIYIGKKLDGSKAQKGGGSMRPPMPR
ncbi:efflux RND transporter periplasmic adaptor subunit [bacterium]|nr:efflux RND transporter periplasmic adaptor subunit [bacterium]